MTSQKACRQTSTRLLGIHCMGLGDTKHHGWCSLWSILGVLNELIERQVHNLEIRLCASLPTELIHLSSPEQQYAIYCPNNNNYGDDTQGNL